MPNKLPVRLFNTKTMETVIHHEFPKSVIKHGYVAVSHVWGEQEWHNPENLGIKKGINWNIPLSNTNKMDMLKKAMKKFKMEWCWWDVLCMPQGEHNQHLVNKEIPYMGDYYNGAKMTLVLSDGEGPALFDHAVKGLWKSLIKHMFVQLHLIAWGFEEDPWISRLWTFQEAVMSKVIWLVRPGGFYLDVSDIMDRLIVSEEKDMLPPDEQAIKLARSIKEYHMYKTNVGRMLYECRNRKCYRPHDKFYGLLGILGYTKFPVMYDITMEELAKKFMEHAYDNGDVSWLAILVKNKTGFIPSYEEDFTYIGELWREEEPGMCGIKFGEDTLWINACIAANITHSVKNDMFTDIRETGKRWGFDELDITHAEAGYRELSNKELEQIRKMEESQGPTLSLNILLARMTIGSHTNVMNKFKRHSNLNPQKLSKIVCEKTGNKMLMTIFGECDAGDKIMLLPMYDGLKRTLGIVVDNKLKRKGICLYPRLDICYNYTPYEFAL